MPDENLELIVVSSHGESEFLFDMSCVRSAMVKGFDMS